MVERLTKRGAAHIDSVIRLGIEAVREVLPALLEPGRTPDISAIADLMPTVYIRWGHKVDQGGAYAYSGWNLDDVEIWAVAADECYEDVNDDNVVDIDDLFDVLAHWGEGPGKYDVNNDGLVDIDDIFAILAAWGPC